MKNRRLKRLFFVKNELNFGLFFAPIKYSQGFKYQ